MPHGQRSAQPSAAKLEACAPLLRRGLLPLLPLADLQAWLRMCRATRHALREGGGQLQNLLLARPAPPRRGQQPAWGALLGRLLTAGLASAAPPPAGSPAPAAAPRPRAGAGQPEQPGRLPGRPGQRCGHVLGAVGCGLARPGHPAHSPATQPPGAGLDWGGPGACRPAGELLPVVAQRARGRSPGGHDGRPAGAPAVRPPCRRRRRAARLEPGWAQAVLQAGVFPAVHHPPRHGLLDLARELEQLRQAVLCRRVRPGGGAPGAAGGCGPTRCRRPAGTLRVRCAAASSTSHRAPGATRCPINACDRPAEAPPVSFSQDESIAVAHGVPAGVWPPHKGARWLCMLALAGQADPAAWTRCPHTGRAQASGPMRAPIPTSALAWTAAMGRTAMAAAAAPRAGSASCHAALPSSQRSSTSIGLNGEGRPQGAVLSNQRSSSSRRSNNSSGSDSSKSQPDWQFLARLAA